MTGTPSMRTRVLSDGAPRRRIEATPPKSPLRLIDTPGTVASTSAATTALRRSISARSTIVAPERSISGAGSREAVTTVSDRGGAVWAAAGAARRDRAPASRRRRTAGLGRGGMRVSVAAPLGRRPVLLRRSGGAGPGWKSLQRDSAVPRRWPGPGPRTNDGDGRSPGLRVVRPILAFPSRWLSGASPEVWMTLAAHSCGHSRGFGARRLLAAFPLHPRSRGDTVLGAD